jgi:hypothetical protein
VSDNTGWVAIGIAGASLLLGLVGGAVTQTLRIASNFDRLKESLLEKIAGSVKTLRDDLSSSVKDLREDNAQKHVQNREDHRALTQQVNQLSDRISRLEGSQLANRHN